MTDAAEHFGVTTRTLRNWAAAGAFPIYRGPAGRTLRVKLDEVEASLHVVPTRVDIPK